MRICNRLLALSLALTVCVLSPYAAFAGKAPEPRGKSNALAEKDPAFAASEKAYAQAREAFLNRFDGDVRKWAETFLERNDVIREYDIDRISRETGYYSQREHRKVIDKRMVMTRYLNLTAQTPATDPAFLILLKPVCYNASYTSRKDLAQQALAEYDAHRNDPYRDLEGYAVRKANGRYWAAILFPGQDIQSYDVSDRFMAFVLRVDADGSLLLRPVIAPVTEDVYPGEKSPLRPEKYQPGPGNMSIDECWMETALSITNTDGPFAFRADVRQGFSGRGLSYACEPKCSGFGYEWNDTTQSFLRDDGICREDEGWKPRSPFDAEGTLLPVAGYIQTLAAGDESVRRHERAVETAVAAYLDLFDGAARELARSDLEGWRIDRQFPLYRFVGDKAAFTEALVANDEPVLAYLRAVTTLARNPDARLTLLLEDFAARLSLRESSMGEKRDDRRYPAVSELVYEGAKPVWFVSYASERTALLKPPAKNSRQRYPYTATGLDGTGDIVFTYDKRSFYSRADMTGTFVMRKAPDGSFWGHALAPVGKDLFLAGYASSPTRLLPVPRQYIMRVHGGKIAFVTPPLPEEKEFFTNPETDLRGRVLWKVPGESRSAPVCDMAPAFSVDTAQAPFAVTAKDIPDTSSYLLCVPECVLPYTWNGTAYVREKPQCLSAGQWGVIRTDRNRRR